MNNKYLFEQIDINEPLKLDCGDHLKNYSIAFKTFGKLNKKKNNAILICHALTGDQFCTGKNSVTKKPGWWNILVGPGKVIDTNIFYVICSNVLGGCMGTTGPSSINSKTKKPFGLGFPVITIGDMVSVQFKLIEKLGIEKLFSVIGGSMGGMQALEWASKYGHKINSVIPIATSYRHSAQNIAFHEIGRQAIMADPFWKKGNYYNSKQFPTRGLAVARMIAHITYLSESALQRKFGRNLQNSKFFSFGFDTDFQIESYLKHQGISFVERFDANSYLYITKAMDYFDLSTKTTGLRLSLPENNLKYCFFSFSSDWLFPTSETKTIIQSLKANNANVSFVEIQTDKGHDSFLLDEPKFHFVFRKFVRGQIKESRL
ncbi:MAG: homoserine O-acetyltransferase [alpha proteobacterium MED-G10]|nr:MAG: homoserine O-acetyltransferase [alpha proteobacterium MED-G10]|tara:strand:+ start:1559 stop:2680 length:1122 start_codon:yes stop_codon:yes gene_type:complete